MKKEKIFPLFLVAIEMITYLSMGMYLPAVEEVKRDFLMSQKEALLSVALWFIGNAVITPGVGFISIAIGRKKVILGATFLSGLLNSGVFLFNTTGLFLLFRFLQGILNSLIFIPANALIHDYFPDKKAIKLIALMNSVLLISSIVGPLLGAFIIGVAPWQTIFILLGLISLVIFYPLLSYLPETKSQEEDIHFDIKKASQYGQFLLCFTFAMGSNALWITASPLIMMQEFQYSAWEYGTFQMGITSGFLLGTILINGLIEKYEINKLIKISKVLSLLFLFIFGLYILFSHSLVILGIIYFLALINFGFIAPVLFRILMTSNLLAKDHIASIISGFLALGALLGSSTATLIYNGYYFPILVAQWICNFFIFLFISVQFRRN